MQSLWEMKVGESGTVKWMMGNSAVMEFLRRHEIKEGNLIRVFQKGKSWKSTICDCLGSSGADQNLIRSFFITFSPQTCSRFPRRLSVPNLRDL